MRESSVAICLSICAILFGAARVAAQNQVQAGVPMVEIFGCNFVGNHDMDDLLAVTV